MASPTTECAASPKQASTTPAPPSPTGASLASPQYQLATMREGRSDQAEARSAVIVDLEQE